MRSENPEHDEVEDDGDEKEGDEPASATDEATEPYEQGAEPGNEYPGAQTRGHVLCGSFPADDCCIGQPEVSPATPWLSLGQWARGRHTRAPLARAVLTSASVRG